MEIRIFVKGKPDPVIFKGDRIDVLDFNMKGTDYKQIRYFKRGFSKSEYIDAKLIKSIKTIE